MLISAVILLASTTTVGLQTDFEGEIVQTIGGRLRADPAMTVVHMNLVVVNRGAPTALAHWKVFATIDQVRREVPVGLSSITLNCQWILVM
jgi:hypothetical protein